MSKPLLPPKSDFVFKRIFGDVRNTDILTDFLQSVLTIPPEEYETVTIVDPHLNKDHEDEKYGVLDVKIKTTLGKLIDVEIQRRDAPNMEQRIMFYTSKMFNEQIGEGDNYINIKQVISILITDYKLYSDTKYHHHFFLRDDEGEIIFTELLEVNTLELPKLPQTNDNTHLYEWLKFLKVETKEELNMIATANPKISKAKGVLLQMSESERERRLYDSYRMHEMDIQNLVSNGYSKGRMEDKIETVMAMFAENDPLDKIARVTKLSIPDIEKLLQ
jgi:predicted transposase/invertase (TIGR01784 family)